MVAKAHMTLRVRELKIIYKCTNQLINVSLEFVITTIYLKS